jgi:phosphatidylglycerol---prolipoprotein diacylglyceryl transferase
MTHLLSIFWDVSPIAFSLLGRDFRWYSLLFVLAIWGAYAFFVFIFKKENLAPEVAQKAIIYSVVSLLIGARLGEVLFYSPEVYLKDPAEIFKIWHGGLSSHGATFALLALIWAFAKWEVKKSFTWLGDRITPAISFSAACVRFGNLFNSEIVGTPTNMPWGFIFHSHDQVVRHPVQLYEGITYIFLCVFLTNYYLKHKNNLADGLMGGIFLTGMFGTRFILEFFKENNSSLTENFPLTMGQLLSLPLLVFGIYLLMRARKNA